MIIKTQRRLCYLLLIVGAIGCTKNKYDVKNAWNRSITLQNNTRMPTHAQGELQVQPLYEVVSDLSSFSQGIDMETANALFEGIASVDTFRGRYFKDGHFARCHAIGRYIANKHNLVCEKLFAFGELTAFSSQLDCYARWNYDVACVLQVEGQQLVFDPKLFTRPVSVQTWLDAHLKPSPLEQHPSLRTHLVVSKEAFSPLDLTPSGFLMDSSGYHMQIMLNYYKDSVGCTQYF